MQEYVSEAVVLTKEPNGDLDSRVSLFTQKFGKLVAKAKSARKITSKLSGHLEPGNYVHARLIEKNGLQVVDALKHLRLDLAPKTLQALHALLPDAEPEVELWHMLHEGRFAWEKTLQIFGWDPRGARCSFCKSIVTSHFRIASQEFFCEQCASKVPESEVIYIR